MKNILGTFFTPRLKGKEHCKNFVQRANSRLLQLWKLRNLNINTRKSNSGLEIMDQATISALKSLLAKSFTGARQ